ncbi:MAG: hypothetical protein ABIH82_03665 [Candidatus Woesearchaeota archaeon]
MTELTKLTDNYIELGGERHVIKAFMRHRESNFPLGLAAKVFGAVNREGQHNIDVLVDGSVRYRGLAQVIHAGKANEFNAATFETGAYGLNKYESVIY